ncbi:MAG: JAB domain-containing protein [Erythrobacter sp.]|uniref:JAB domain-containing protein n=1 Tax=Erythrobacter sp. TaxID=1042 RepID=UPI003299A316
MIQEPVHQAADSRSHHDHARIDFMRAMVIAKPYEAERFHALFVDEKRSYLGDAPMGIGGSGQLALRMRDLFAKALSLNADGVLVAHNHPSGQCRPSRADTISTQRLEKVASALDIELVDHLIFTKDAVYSMRAGAIHEFKSRKSILP